MLDDILTLDELVQFVKDLVVLGNGRKKTREVTEPKRTSLTPGKGASSARSSFSNSTGTNSGNIQSLLLRQ